jgi:S-formylglutathione hydrolase FrmB
MAKSMQVSGLCPRTRLALRSRVRATLLTITSLVACSHGSTTPGEGEDANVSQLDSSQPADSPSPDASVGFLCNQPPPAGAPTPTPPPLPVAGCPMLASGSNTITSSGVTRTFLLALPANPMPGEKFPVLFMWHWLGGSAHSFLEKGNIQEAADQQRFIAVLPDSIGATVAFTSFNTRWPFDITQLPTRMDQEFTFFDDMLACVEQQYEVNQSCVSTVGVSAGALFTDQLAQARSDRLASFISLSGGVGDTIIKPWSGAAKKLPGVVLWGGDGPPSMDGNKDILGCFGIGMDFSVASNDLETGLVHDGHFFVECKHNCGHVEPPLDAPPGLSKYAGMWEFALNHPFWLPAGQSPWSHGLPASLPAWCGIGADSATPRSGPGCPMAENPCQY